MRPLPTEIVHDPVETGPYRMALGLTVVPESDWFEIDTLYPAEMIEKRRLMTEHRADVRAALPESADARAETLDVVADHLCHHHPDWFHRDGHRLENCLTQDVWESDAADPLDIASLLAQEDLCLIQNKLAGPFFTAGVVCFPSRWRLSEKIGRPLAEVHGPVPMYAERLAGPVDRFMRHLRPGRMTSRLNWSILDDPALFQPAGKWRVDRNEAITADNAGDKLFLRVERQTFRLLPRSGAVLFGIRVHVYPLWRVASSRLADAVRALPDATTQYKSLPPFRPALLAWLDRRAATYSGAPQ